LPGEPTFRPRKNNSPFVFGHRKNTLLKILRSLNLESYFFKKIIWLYCSFSFFFLMFYLSEKKSSLGPATGACRSDPQTRSVDIVASWPKVRLNSKRVK
jgi:hypothetical protein